MKRFAMRAFALTVACLVSFVWLLLSPISRAQSTDAAVTGLVTDPHGKAVPGAVVVITNIGTAVETRSATNNDGIYWLPSLIPGIYRINLSKDGFKSVVKSSIELHVQDVAAINFELQIGSVSETVTVSGTNTMWATTDSPAVSTLITRDFVENMPLNGRSFEDLISLTPGTVSSADSSYGGFSINGQRDDANYFTVDGVGANVYSGNIRSPQAMAGVNPLQTAIGTTQALLSVDALDEFRIQTSGYTADSGRQPGGQVQLTSRSGTNDWHGTGFDYLRNTVFDANSFFNNEFGIERGAERQNDFGGTIGGPVKLPGIYDGKDRTFFFFSYEGLRLLLPASVHEYEPTVAFRQAAAVGVQPFLNAFPIPNGPPNTTDGCVVSTTSGNAPCDAQFNAGYSNPSTVDVISLRIDHNWGQALRLFGRFSNTPSVAKTRAPSPASEVQSGPVNTKTFTLGAIANISRVVNDLRFNYSQSKTSYGISLDTFGGAVPFSSSLLIPSGFATAPGANSYAFICVSGTLCYEPGITSPTPQQQHQYNIADSLSLVRGSHALKFGLDYRRLQPNYSRSGPYSATLDFFSVDQVQQGQADDLVAAARHETLAFTNLSLYAQDRWRASSRLTLDYGIRWEFNPVPGPVEGLAPPALTQVSDLSNLQFAPTGTPAYKTKYLNFAPRVGFSWNAGSWAGKSFVVRGGFGVYYDTGQAQWGAAYGTINPPFGARYDVPNVSLPFTNVSFPAPPTIPQVPQGPPYRGLGLMDPHLRLPYTEQYDLSVDVGLSPRNTLTLSYVGNQGHALLESRFYSSVPNFSSLTLTTNDGTSNYNGLQIQDRGFVGKAFELVASYTWAHAIDNVSTDQFAGSAPLRGNSDNDIRQVFAAAVNYHVPHATSDRFLRAVTNGWLVAGRFTAQSGYPFNVIQGQYIANQNFMNIYPDLIPGVPLYLHGAAADLDGEPVPGNWRLNSAAFSSVPLNPDGSPVQQGNLPRNFLKQPGFWNLNTAIQRTFPLHEPLKLVFRAEAFNIFNHPNFNQVDSNLGDSTFGQLFGVQTVGSSNQLYATGSPRSWQFMLKLEF